MAEGLHELFVQRLKFNYNLKISLQDTAAYMDFCVAENTSPMSNIWPPDELPHRLLLPDVLGSKELLLYEQFYENV
jgi:hypothetical protein